MIMQAKTMQNTFNNYGQNYDCFVIFNFFFVKTFLIRGRGKVFCGQERYSRELSRGDRNVVDLVLGGSYMHV